jgi:hypothetical protein
MKLKQIANDYDLVLINVTKRNIDKYLAHYSIERPNLINNAYIIGDEIILGLYDSNEVRIASFFHEIGHTVITESYSKMTNYDLMLNEYQAWIEGLKIAKRYGYTFTTKTFRYILRSVNSYYKDALSAYNVKNEKN